jgi:hypothetical protein
MARTLDTPDVQPDATQQAITRVRFDFPQVRNDGDTAMEHQSPLIQVWYEVITYDAAGLGIESATRTVKLDGWSASFKTEVKTVYDHLMVEAETAGLIAGPGTDDPFE